MSSTHRQMLERQEATYMHDYVVGGADGDIEGVIVGLSDRFNEALIHRYNEGSPTMTIHAVDRHTLEHHAEGRAD